MVGSDIVHIRAVAAGGLHVAYWVSTADTFCPSPPGKPFNPLFMLSRSVSNIICSVVFGSRFHYDDERLLTIIRLINDNFQIMSTPWGEVSELSSGGPTGSRGQEDAASEEKTRAALWPQPAPTQLQSGPSPSTVAPCRHLAPPRSPLPLQSLLNLAVLEICSLTT